MFRSAAALVLAAVIFSGCSSVEASTAVQSPATPSLPCSLPYGTRVSLVSPAPGSAGSTPNTIVLAASRDLPKTIALVATDRKGAVTPGVPLERIPRRHHGVEPTSPEPVYYRATGVALHAHRHYTFALDDLAQNGCAPYAAIAGNPRIST